MRLTRALNQRATHENTLVMRSSLGGDEDQGAEVATVVRDRRRRVRSARGLRRAARSERRRKARTGLFVAVYPVPAVSSAELTGGTNYRVAPRGATSAVATPLP